jgi:ABC-type transport system involved in cytochrome c biogenesis permease subunit
MRKIVYAVAIMAIVGVAAWTLRSRPQSIELSTAAMPSLQELHLMAGVEKLPNQDIDDQSLVYTTAPKQ